MQALPLLVPALIVYFVGMPIVLALIWVGLKRFCRHSHKRKHHHE